MQKIRLTAYAALISLTLSNLSYAATLIDVWDEPSHIPILNQFYFDNQISPTKSLPKYTYLFSSQNKQKINSQQFKPVKVNTWDDESHVRYAQYYQGVPVWGTQIIVHHKNRTKVTGAVISGIENDINSIKPSLSATEAQKIADIDLRKRYPEHKYSSWRLPKTNLIIYIDKQNENDETGKAKLAYYVTFFVNDYTSKHLRQPVYLIDAMTGKIFTQYDNVKTAVGTGPGGNNISLSYRSTNHYQFGNAISGLLSLGNLPVTVDATSNLCTMITSQIRLSSYKNVTGSDNNFPILYTQESSYPVFSYTCSSATSYQNADDGGYAPINNGGYIAYSPSNDTFYFSQLMYQLMQIYLPSVTNPWGTLLPIRAYTHVGLYDNAFAISPVNDVEQPLSVDERLSATNFNPQLVIGNGDTSFYPLSDAGTVGHELSHIFTSYHSNLIYSNQSGGINEAYSDIAGQTLEYYLSQQFAWYGFSWDISASVSLPSGPYAGKALRYFSNPPLDGHSIANAANFVPGMDVHYSSGVYNYAFYLMVNRGVNFYNAYQYFSRANVAYWQPSSDYNHASCGVMQAAFDLGHRSDYQTIMRAFNDVGVKCKIGFSQLASSI